MSLGSVSFLLFALASVAVYYLLPQRLRSAFLTAAGAVFYCFGAPVFLPLLVLTSLWCYGAGLLLEKLEGRGRTAAAAVGVAVPVAVLCSFKYSAGPLGRWLSGMPLLSSAISETAGGFSLIMPLGISFYTFTLVGYLLDVYHGRVKAERNLADFLAFATFFPCILSGPINRAGEMLPQFKQKHVWSYAGTVYGLQRFLTGALKKVVIADGLSLIVNGVWAAPSQYGAAAAWLAAIGYTVQLYCDFSGYTDMAAGTAALFGFRTRENFNAPYTASSITDFWSRWHMSLTSWLRDYIYIPLGGNRKGYARKLINIVLVFTISGLWHGEGMTCLVWGLFHGVLRCCEDVAAKVRKGRAADGKKPPLVVRVLKHLYTLAAVTFGWILFRAPSLADAGGFLSALFSGGGQPLDKTLQFFICEGLTYSKKHLYVYSIFLIGGLILLALLERRTVRTGSLNPMGGISGKKRWLVYWFAGLGCAAFYIMMLTLNNGVVSFIYQGY